MLLEWLRLESHCEEEAWDTIQNGERQVHKQILWILAMYQQHTSLDGLIEEYIAVISLVNAMKNVQVDVLQMFSMYLNASLVQCVL
jgi:hypothetical protein